MDWFKVNFTGKLLFFHVSTLTSTVSGRFSLHPVLRSDQSQLVSNLLAQTVSAISPRHKSLRVSSSPQPNISLLAGFNPSNDMSLSVHWKFKPSPPKIDAYSWTLITGGWQISRIHDEQPWHTKHQHQQFFHVQPLHHGPWKWCVWT